jgi:hypothetical protein
VTIDYARLGPDESRGFHPREDDQRLIIELSKDFDLKREIHSWSHQVISACPGPYREVVANCHGHSLLSSTCIAGLVHLRDHYAPAPLVMIHSNERIQHTLVVMHLADLFVYRDHLDEPT